MSKQEQVLQIEPQNELKFRGENLKCDIDVFFSTNVSNKMVYSQCVGITRITKRFLRRMIYL